MFYAPLLAIIIAFAPGCVPNRKLISNVWLELNENHTIKDPAVKGSHPVWANESADIVRIACGHVKELKKCATAYLPPEIRGLIERAVLDEEDVLPPVPEPVPLARRSEQVPPARLSEPAPPARRLKARISSASVEMCGVTCVCPECVKPIDVDSVGVASVAAVVPAPGRRETSPARSETSLAAMEYENVVPAQRGGHKQNKSNMYMCIK